MGLMLATNVFERQAGQWKVRCAELTACSLRRCTPSEARSAALVRQGARSTGAVAIPAPPVLLVV